MICAECGRKLTGKQVRYFDGYLRRGDGPPERIKRPVCDEDFQRLQERVQRANHDYR